MAGPAPASWAALAADFRAPAIELVHTRAREAHAAAGDSTQTHRGHLTGWLTGEPDVTVELSQSRAVGPTADSVPDVNCS